MSEADSGERKPERRGHPALWPLILSCLLLCGLAWAIWSVWSVRAKGAERAEAQAREIESLSQTRDELLGLLALPPCEAKKRLAPAAPEAAAKPEAAGAKPASAPRAARGKVDEIESACVFIVAPDGKARVSTGSGFFVAPGYVATNKHVVEKGAGRALVTSHSLGHAVRAKVIATSRERDGDFALLRVEMPPGAEVAVLPFASGARKTEKVGAWGFPDVIGKNDPAYARLLAGADIAAVPELTYTEGVVSAVLPRQPRLIAHTAPISPGSSGGPLLNEAGEVVGINTMITLDDSSFRQASIALDGQALLDFLNANGLKP